MKRNLCLAILILVGAMLVGCGGDSPSVVAVWDTDVEEQITFYSDGTVTAVGPNQEKGHGTGLGTGTRESFSIQWSSGVDASCSATLQSGNTYYVTWTNSTGTSGHYYAFER